MGIHILLAGEQIGPFSETQVRQYIGEGLVSPSDLATCEGKEDWQSVEVLLANLPPSPPEPEPVIPQGPIADPSPLYEETTAAAAPEPVEIPKPSEASSGSEASPPSLPENRPFTLNLLQKAKQKPGKIVIEPIRPTTALPPVIGFAPKDKTTTKSLPRPGQLALRNSAATSALAVPITSNGFQPPAIVSASTTRKASSYTKESDETAPAESWFLLLFRKLGAWFPPAPITETPQQKAVSQPIEEPKKEPLVETVTELKAPVAEPIVTPAPETKPSVIEPAVVPIPESKKPATEPEIVPVQEENVPITEPMVVPVPEAKIPVEEPVVVPVKESKSPVSEPVTAAAKEVKAAVVEPAVVPVTEPKKQPAKEIVKRPAEIHEPQGLFPRLLRTAFYLCCALALLISVLSVYFFLRLSTPHDKGPGAILLKSESPELLPSPSEIAANEANPKSSTDFAARAAGKQATGDSDGALADYNQALTLDPKNIQAAYHRGLIRMTKNDLSGALADYNTVIGIDQKNAEAFSNRAYVKQTLGDADGAIADYGQALMLNPKDAVAFYNVGLIKVNTGDLDGAISAFSQALDLNPKMADAYYKRGNAKNTENNLDGAIADYTQALVINPKMAMAYCNRGFARQTKEDLGGALADYAEALAINPKLTLVYYNRGLIRMLKGDLDGAIDDSTAALAYDSKYGQAYCNRGLARFGKGDLAGAMADLRKFCELAPRDGNTDTARLYLWLAATQLNPKGTADQDLSLALQNDWNSPPEDFSSKIAAFLLGHMRESELIANAASPDPSQEPGQYCEAWYFAGMKRLLSGDTKTAITYFQKSVATDQTDFSDYIFAKTELQNLGQNDPVVPKASVAR